MGVNTTSAQRTKWRVECARRGWSQGRLAKELGMTQGAISKVFCGSKSRQITIDAIDVALDVKPSKRAEYAKRCDEYALKAEKYDCQVFATLALTMATLASMEAE